MYDDYDDDVHQNRFTNPNPCLVASRQALLNPPCPPPAPISRCIISFIHISISVKQRINNIVSMCVFLKRLTIDALAFNNDDILSHRNGVFDDRWWWWRRRSPMMIVSCVAFVVVALLGWSSAHLTRYSSYRIVRVFRVGFGMDWDGMACAWFRLGTWWLLTWGLA